MKPTTDSSALARRLHDPSFLAALERLRLVARRVARGGRPAEHRSRAIGGGIEFRDFRPYSPGDDFRAIDWNIYGRLGRVFLRLFEEVQDLPVYLLVDTSRSLFLETPPRAHAGFQVAVALAAIALSQHDRVALYGFNDDLQTVLRPRAGRERVLEFIAALTTLPASGATDFERALARFGALGLREGLAVVISDFFDPRGLEAITRGLGALRHRLLLVQLSRASDATPALAGDFELVDCETDAVAEVSVTQAVIEKYRTAYEAFTAGLVRLADRRHAGLLRIDTDTDVLPQLEALFATGSYAV
ncbi:MAG: DUF58 domain-containing protein [Planctomycetota bacterium]